ncbi:Crp/Fnr family transcriptional regulator [Mucilaginibacter sp. BJC16-A38]|uniref:Crp/Fnr family transcriptional regulator n=1 Tax=Mucilaginibacter phenanthrenivorans TaxID=1234842 RepID=UPI0021588F58|nr:Crp/Fnr family transcriptional regulator [Mucilaginibacter phenanthrenivorans]MCR8559000.1 Crp/Fnr family transcriptional regulator [Mucilaginibacter phenanthrenivorans]
MTNAQLLGYLGRLIPHSPESTATLLSHFEYKAVQKGAAVLNAGEICTAFYFVESGYLRTYYNKAGVEINIHFHLEGTVTSDHKNGKEGIPSEFTIAAGEKSEIWILNRETLTALCYADPGIMVFGRGLLNRMLLDQSAHSNLFKMYTPAERYQYIERNNPELLQRIPLSNLASFLGMNRRTLSRIRARKQF